MKARTPPREQREGYGQSRCPQGIRYKTFYSSEVAHFLPFFAGAAFLCRLWPGHGATQSDAVRARMILWQRVQG